MQGMEQEAGRIRLAPTLPERLPLSRDDRLARAAARGDERAFSAIYSRYHQRLYRYCRAIVGNHEEAEDALQATMVRVLRSLPGEGREIALKPWLYRVAHNEAISIARARRQPLQLDDDVLDLDSDPEEAAATRERLRELVDDLGHLPERQRGALVMRELSGMSFEEIGGVFGVRPASIKQAVYEARASLTEMSEGRAMECEQVRESVSSQDRRVLRGRKISSHLRQCEGCRAFEAAISLRRKDFSMLAPPLAAPASLAALHALVGANGGAGAATAAAGGGSALGGGVGAGIGGAVIAKSAAIVASGVILAGGAAEVTGVIDLDGRQDRADSAAPAAAPSAPARGAERAQPSDVIASNPAKAHGRGAATEGGKPGARNGQSGSDPGNAGGHGAANAPGQANNPASGAQGSAHSNAGGSPPAHATAGGQSAAHSNAGGQPDAPPSNSNAGGSPSNAGGQSAVHSNAGGSPAASSNSNSSSTTSVAPADAGGLKPNAAAQGSAETQTSP